MALLCSASLTCRGQSSSTCFSLPVQSRVSVASGAVLCRQLQHSQQTRPQLPVLATSNASPCGRQRPPPRRHCCYPDVCSAQVSPLTHARNQETVQASTRPLMAHRHDWASPQRPLPLPGSVFKSHGPTLAQVFIPSSYSCSLVLRHLHGSLKSLLRKITAVVFLLILSPSVCLLESRLLFHHVDSAAPS